MLPKIVGHHARRKARISLGNLDVSRDFSVVRDVVATYAKLLDVASVEETFNICSGHGHSLGQMLAMLAKIAGYRIEVFVDLRFMQRNEIARLVGCNHKLRRAIGTVPHTPIVSTLEWMYEFMSAQVAV